MSNHRPSDLKSHALSTTPPHPPTLVSINRKQTITGKRVNYSKLCVLFILRFSIHSLNNEKLLFHDRYELITECWREDPSTRPSFFQLIEKLEVLLEGDVEYFDLNKYDESSPYYNVPLEASSAVTAL